MDTPAKHMTPPGSTPEHDNSSPEIPPLIPPLDLSRLHNSVTERLLTRPDARGICGTFSYRSICFLLSSVDALVSSVLFFRVMRFLLEDTTNKQNDMLEEAIGLPLIIAAAAFRATAAISGFLAFRLGALPDIKRYTITCAVNLAHTCIVVFCALTYTFCSHAQLLPFGALDPQKVESCWRLRAEWACDATALCLAPHTLPHCDGCILHCSFGAYTMRTRSGALSDAYCMPRGFIDPNVGRAWGEEDAATGAMLRNLRILFFISVSECIAATYLMRQWGKALQGEFKWQDSPAFSLSMEDGQIRNRYTSQPVSSEMTRLATSSR